MILLINIDSVIPNYALKKIEKYYLDRGEEVIWDNELMKYSADKIFVSCIFSKNKSQCEEWESCAEIGGSGYNIYKKLPLEIESIKPKINWGFTTRGCIRKCSFCFVPKMEGNIHIVGDVYDLWDGVSKEIRLMDNNILALPDHFIKICNQLRKEKIKVDFNQGLDLRILYNKPYLAEELKTIKHFEYRYAWDLEDSKMPQRLEWVRETIGRASIYVLAGLDSFENIVNRLNIIKKIGHRAYLMRHESVYRDKKYTLLARWVNQRHIFSKMSFDEFKVLQQTR